jgi:hypothetical protein
VEGVSSSLKLKLREDRRYNYGRFVEQVRKGVGITLGNSCLEELFDGVRRFVDGTLRPAIEGFIVKDLDVESPPPIARRDEFNLGQWIGFFDVEGPLCGFDSVVIEVEPKIGWSKFKYMVEESLKIPATIGFESLAPTLANLMPYSDYVVDIVYSDLAYRYTEMALRGPLPRIVEEMVVLSEGQLGRVDVVRTLKLRAAGSQLLASRRTRLAYAHMPLILVARFHYRLLGRLNKIVEDLGRMGGHEVLRGVLERIEMLKRRHAYILTLTPVAAYLDLALRADVEDSVLVREARARSGVNTWLRALADLYESYNSRLAGVEVRRELPLQLLPSSKVFELWVLKLIIEVLGINGGVRVERVDSGLTIEARGVKLHYNKPHREGRLLRGLRGFLRDGALRPDYVMERNGEVVVADAKYKARVSVGDVERMAAYIVDVATPLRADGERLVGVLVVLTGNKPKTSKAVADEELTTKHELRVAHVNPSKAYEHDNVATVKKALLQVTR